MGRSQFIPPIQERGAEWGIFEPLFYLSYDIRCGLHSGFPWCCVAWYIGPWSWLGLVRMHRLYTAWVIPRWGVSYVPCPVCVLRGRKVRVLDCECFKEEVERYRREKGAA